MSLLRLAVIVVLLMPSILDGRGFMPMPCIFILTMFCKFSWLWRNKEKLRAHYFEAPWMLQRHSHVSMEDFNAPEHHLNQTAHTNLLIQAQLRVEYFGGACSALSC